MRLQPRLFLTLTVVAAALFAQEPPAGIPDSELGLARGSVFEVPAPEPVRPPEGDPGDGPLVPREYEGSPPRVPHAVDDYLPVTREDNLCVDCHAISEAGEGDPTPLPASHYTDLRRTPDRVGETVAGARWVCSSCHVPLTGAEPLVGNDFARAAAAPSPRERASRLPRGSAEALGGR